MRDEMDGGVLEETEGRAEGEEDRARA